MKDNFAGLCPSSLVDLRGEGKAESQCVDYRLFRRSQACSNSVEYPQFPAQSDQVYASLFLGCSGNRSSSYEESPTRKCLAHKSLLHQTSTSFLHVLLFAWLKSFETFRF